MRSGPSPEFTKNWDSVFGGKNKAAKATARSAKATTKSAKTKTPAKAAKKATAKKK